MMSDYDPNRRDPLFEIGRGYNWNWLVAVLAAIVVLLIAFSFVERDNETADRATPSVSTTGQGTTTQRPSSPNQ